MRYRIGLAVFAFLIMFSAVSCLSVETSHETIQAYSNEIFTISVDFNFQNAENAILSVNFDYDTLQLLGPADTVSFGSGTFQGKLNYTFKAIKDFNSSITFELRDKTRQIQEQTFIFVTPRHLEFSVNKETIYASTNTEFEIQVSMSAENSKDVELKINYDQNVLSTNQQSATYLGTGTFSEIRTLVFSAKETDTASNQKIKISLCSKTECFDKEILVVVQALSVTSSIESQKLKPGDTFGVIYSFKNFNNGQGILEFYFDENWFELLGSSKRNVRQDDAATETVYFKMKEQAATCPEPRINIRLSAGNLAAESEVSVDFAPTLFAEKPAPKFVGFGETFESRIKIFYFGFENGKVEVDFPPNLKHQQKDFELSGCGADELLLEFTAKEQGHDYSLGNIGFVFRDNFEVSKTITQDITVVKTSSELFRLCNPGISIKGTGESTTLARNCIPIMPPITCPPAFEYNPVTGKCEKRPPFEIVCEIGEYNEEIDSCVYYPELSIVCEIGEYNSELDLCIYLPHQQIVCETGSYDSSLNLCVYYPELQLVCPENYEFNSNSNFCEQFPETEIVCSFGEYNPVTQTCQYYPLSEILCLTGTYNSLTEKCEVIPETEIICLIGNYNSELNLCQYYPDVQAVCETGSFNSSTNTCQYYPETEIVCELGEFNIETMQCILNPAPIIICPNGLDFSLEHNACVAYPDTSYICTEGGQYEPSLGKCLIDVSELLCDTPNATYSNGTCTLVVNSEIQCNTAGAVYINGICTYSVDSIPVCSSGTFDPASNKCVYSPPIQTLCSRGDYNPVLEACVYTPETRIQCLKGNYNPETDTCDYSPEPSLKVSELNVQLNEVFAFTADIFNDFDSDMEIKDYDLVVSDNSAIRILSSSLGVSSLEPGETSRLSYLVKFEKPGTYNATLNIRYGEQELSKPYVVRVRAPETAISGMYYAETPYLPMSMGILLASVIGTVATVISMKIKLKEKFD